MSGFLKSINHSNRLSLSPAQTKNLQDVISSEKRVVEATHRLSAERIKSSVALKEWGASEGPDLSDVLTKLSMLFDYLSTAEKTYADHDENFRLHFKNIRNREEELSNLRKSKDSLQSKIESLDKKVSKMKEENKDLPGSLQRLAEMRQEMQSMEHSVLKDDASLGDFKRSTTREAMSLKLGALLELAEKSVVVGELGKLMVEEIPLDRTEPGHPRAPYNNFEKTDELMQQAQKCIQDVVFNPVSINDQYGGEQTGGYQSNQYHERGPSGEDGQQDFGGGQQHGGAYAQDSWHSNGTEAYGGQDNYRQPYGGDDSYNQPSSGGVYGEQRQGYLPEIHSASTLTGASHLPAGARTGGDNDSFVDSYRAAEATQALGVPQIDSAHDPNRSSLAYMDGPAPATNAWNESSLPTHQEEDETLARERAQAEEALLREKAEAEETERQELERRGKAKQESMMQPYRYNGPPAVGATTSTQDYQPRETQDAPPPSSAPQDPRAEGLLYSPPPPTHNKYYPESIERPYVPREGDGAYHGPIPQQPPPPSSSALPPISTTAPLPPTQAATQTALPLSPRSPSPQPQTPTQSFGGAPAPVTASPQQPQSQTPSQRKPIMIRGESALGSKYGDVFVQGAQGAVTTTPSFVPSDRGERGATTPTTSSGYFRGGAGDDRSTNSAEPRKVNAGAFRRAQPVGVGATGSAGGPQFGSTMSGPSQADAIRDLYRSNSQSEEQQQQQQQQAQGGGGPRFDVSPLQVNKGRPPQARAGSLPPQDAWASTADSVPPPPSYQSPHPPPAIQTNHPPVGAAFMHQPASPNPTSTGFGQQQFVTRLD